MKDTVHHIFNLLSTKARFILIFCCLFVCTAINYLAIFSLQSSLKEKQLQLDLAYQNETRLVQIQQHIREVIYDEAGTKRILLAEVASYKTTMRVLLQGGETTVNEVAIYIPACQADLQPLLAGSEKSWDAYAAMVQSVLYEPVFRHRRMATTHADSTVKASSSEYVKTLNPALQTILKEIDLPFNQAFTAQNHAKVALSQAFEQQRANFNSTLFELFIIQALVLGAALYYIWRFILKPFHTLHEAASQINEGNFNTQINTALPKEAGNIALAIQRLLTMLQQATNYVRQISKGTQDAPQIIMDADAEKGELFVALHDMQQQLLKMAKEEEKRNWGTERMAQFSDVLRHSTSDLSETSYQALYHIIKYIEASQGGIFLLNDQDEAEPYLELKACYAYNKKKYRESRIAIGQGLVGQVFLEQNSLCLTQVPEDYIQITSGLGEDTPRNILIVPLKSGETVYGVIEIASFSVFEPHIISFIEKVSENIASSISAVRINEHTRRLLEESQLFTYQLKEQEEEMRQNVEELQATQEDMKRNQALLAGQSHAINTTLITMEFDMESFIVQVNDIFLETMKYQIQQIKGRKHHLLVEESYAQSNAYAGFWQDLKDGKVQQGEYKQINSQGEEIWLKATFTPIKDQNGTYYRVIGLAFDITAEKKISMDLTGKMKAISRSTAMIELDCNGYIMETNDIFANLIQYKKEDLLGKHYQLFLAENDRNDPAHTYLWEQVMAGNYRSRNYQIHTASGNVLWTENNYNPITDLYGQIGKVILFITDITVSKHAEMENERLLVQTRNNEEELRENLLEMERKEAEIQRLVTEMKLNEEELQRTEEQLRKNMEKMQLSQQKLKEKTIELERIREEENQKVQELIIVHQKEIIVITNEINRFGKEIRELKSELAILKNESLT